jgi:phosphoglucomutase
VEKAKESLYKGYLGDSMDKTIQNKAKQWAENPYFDDADRKEIQNLIDSKNEVELSERFYKDLEFGTAGLRSIMGIGSNRMNKYNVRKATQAMVNTVNKHNLPKKICVSYDSRNNSKFFAEQTCGVLVANGFEAFIYDELTPVPMLSFATRYHKASAGIMITASHNPIEYNGFKAFWSDGAQITPPYDKEIIGEYQSLNDWNDIQFKEFDSKKVHYNKPEVKVAYFNAIKEVIIQKDLIRSKGEELNIVFTPIHGTGLKPCRELATELGFTNFNVVEKQAQPDGDFPTVESPNPEYPAALKLAVEQMQSSNADIVMGTDPDTDRLGVAVLHKEKVHYLTGNELASLFVYYLATQKKERNQLGENPLLLKSIVTSDLQSALAEDLGIELVNTLTGFKWMAKELKEREEKNIAFDFLFANEESFGFMGHKEVRDKDGVCAVMQMSEIALHYKVQGKTVIDALNEIYERYGLYYDTVMSLNYYGREGADKIKRIMNSLRNRDIKEALGQKLIHVSDFQTLKEYNLSEKTEKSFEFEKSNLLSFTYDKGVKFLARPSGTEPKVKFYFMIQKHEGSLEQRKEDAAKTTEEWQNYIKEFCERT